MNKRINWCRNYFYNLYFFVHIWAGRHQFLNDTCMKRTDVHNLCRTGFLQGLWGVVSLPKPCNIPIYCTGNLCLLTTTGTTEKLLLCTTQVCAFCCLCSTTWASTCRVSWEGDVPPLHDVECLYQSFIHSKIVTL